MQNIPLNSEYMPLPEALKRGALAFFGDKYNPEEVRIGRYSSISLRTLRRHPCTRNRRYWGI